MAASDARLLAGIMGHNLCLDIFGPPSDEEALAGLTAHGEGSVADYDLAVSDGALTARAHFPNCGSRIRTAHHAPRSGGHDSRDVEEPHECRSPDRLDAARDAGAAVPRTWRDAVSLVRDAVEGLRVDVRSGRLPGACGGVRVADGAEARWRDRGPSDVYRCGTIERATPRTSWTGIGARPSSWRIHPPAGLSSATSGGRRIFPGWESGKRTTVASSRRGTDRR